MAKPWQLTHLLVLKWLGFGLFYGGRFLLVLVFCGLEEGNVMALGVGKELPC